MSYNRIMRVAVYHNNNDVRIEEVSQPEINDDEVLVKVLASGICGSDVMEWYRIKKAPVVLGHEITGEIEKKGRDVKKYKEGDRVFVSHHVPCNTCHYCLNGNHTACETLHTTNYHPGGFSEYIRVPALNVDRGLYLLPEEVSYEEGTFIEPLACVVRGQRLSGLRPGMSVLIIGSGMSGLLHIELARALGAGRIIAVDINYYRLSKAMESGADEAINAGKDIHKQVKDVNRGSLADLVIVCTGVLSVAEESIKCVDRGGTVLFFAVPRPEEMVSVPMNDLWRDEIKLMTSYGAGPSDIETAIKLIQNRRVDVSSMITHRLPLDSTAEGFRLVADAGESLKVIIEPHE